MLSYLGVVFLQKLTYLPRNMSLAILIRRLHMGQKCHRGHMPRDKPESGTLFQRLKRAVSPLAMIFALVAYQTKSVEPGKQSVGVNLIITLRDEASRPKERLHGFTKVPFDEQINGSHALGPHREVACLFFRQFAGEIILIGIGAV